MKTYLRILLIRLFTENFKFMKSILLIIVILSVSIFSARALQWAISTNAVDWLNFGTINIEGSVAVSRYVVSDKETAVGRFFPEVSVGLRIML